VIVEIIKQSTMLVEISLFSKIIEPNLLPAHEELRPNHNTRVFTDYNKFHPSGKTKPDFCSCAFF